MAITKPFYPGYLPGEEKEPLPGGGMIEQTKEFDYDDIVKEIDDLNIDLATVPVWIKDQIEDDMRFQMRAAVFGQKVSLEEAGAHGEEELEDIPGAAGWIFDLDLEEWVKDPAGQLKKNAQRAAGAIFDSTDVSARIESEAWRKIISGNGPQIQGVRKAAVDATVAEVLARSGRAGALQLNDINAINTTVKNAGNGIGNKLLAFQQQKQVGFFRDGNYDAFSNENVKGVIAELEAAAKLKRDGTNISILSTTQRDAIQSFAKRASVVTHLGDTDDLINKVEEEAAKYMIEQGDGSGVKKAIDALHLHLNGDAAAGTESVFEKLNGLPQADQNQLKHILNPYVAHLEDLKRAVGTPGATISRAQAKILENRLHSIRAPGFRRGSFVKGDPFRSSLQRKLLRELEQEMLAGGVVVDGTNILEAVTAVVENAGYDSLISRVRRHIPKQREDRAWHMRKELLSQMESGKMMKLYVWGRIKERLHGFTPAYFVEKTYERMHAFGLKIDDKIANATPRNPIFQIANGIVKAGYNKDHGGGFFQNNFSLTFKVGGQHFRVKTWGGDHFGAVANLGTLISTGIIDQNTLKDLLRSGLTPDQIEDRLLPILLQAGKISVGEDALAFIAQHQLTASRLKNILQAGTGGRFTEDFKKLTGDAKKARESLQKFIKWLEDHGADALDIENSAILAALIQELNKYSTSAGGKILGLTKKYAGVLEKATKYLNILQDTVLKSFIGKIAGVAINIKNIIAARLSEFLVGAISIGTEGIGALIAPALKWALQWVIKKVLDIGEAIAKVVVTLDLTALDKVLDESLKFAAQLLKWTVAIIAIPLAIGCMILAVIFGAVSPTNPAKGIGGDFQELTETYTPSGPPPPAVKASCPINPANRIRGCESYPLCHGTTSYWGGIGKNCSYTIPWIANSTSGCAGCPNNCAGAACAPTNPGGFCATLGKTPQQSYYGYAFDVSTSGDNTVYLPEIGGVETWHVGNVVAIGTPPGSWGHGVFLTASDSEFDYKMALLHLKPAMWTATVPGDPLGTLYEGPGFGKHVHIELMINGRPVKPEDYFCL
jgi:hypothetical protein